MSLICPLVSKHLLIFNELIGDIFMFRKEKFNFLKVYETFSSKLRKSTKKYCILRLKYVGNIKGIIKR